MVTEHKIHFQNSQSLSTIETGSVDIVVTSPPYPMISMWDESFIRLNPEIGKAIDKGEADTAFSLMHRELNKIWDELYRIVKPSGIVCINIGDATRSINGNFRLFSNHSTILEYNIGLGYICLPSILWRKTTNAPNKFMGSGMLPPGAYVTLEHENILILRKGNRPDHKTAYQKDIRRKSAYFWEERNTWFSDVWTLTGVNQKLKQSETRDRSGAFPFEIAYRLINMFSVQGDIVVDPFLGTGTTTIAAIASGRNSIGIELDSSLKLLITSSVESSVSFAQKHIEARLQKHRDFITQREQSGKQAKYLNEYHGFKVMSSQEKGMVMPYPDDIHKVDEGTYNVSYRSQDTTAK